MLDKVLIGKRIRERRKESGISQELLAEWAGLSPSHISKIENGINDMSLETFASIASILRVPADYLLHGEQLTIPGRDMFGDLMKDMSEQEQMLLYDVIKTVRNGLKMHFTPDKRSG